MRSAENTIPAWRLICTALAIGAIASSCAIPRKGERQSLSKKAPNLAGYKSVLVSVASNEDDSESVVADLKKTILKDLRDRKVFPSVSWIAPGKTNPKWDLRLGLQITRIVQLSTSTRLMAGIDAAEESVHLTGTWIDNKTGKVLDTFIVKASSKGQGIMKRGLAFSIEESAEQVSKYAMELRSGDTGIQRSLASAKSGARLEKEMDERNAFQERGYWSLALQYAALQYSGVLETAIQGAGSAGASRRPIGFEGGGYSALANRRTLVGFDYSFMLDSLSIGALDLTINHSMFSFSTVHYFGSRAGQGVFVRGDLGGALMGATGASSGQEFEVETKYGVGSVLGLGYSIPITRGFRMNVNANYSPRYIATHGTTHAIAFGLGVLF